MITFRHAQKSDQKAIAHLHAKSWQENYRGSVSDHYLDNEVNAERLSIWEKRFSNTKKNQIVFIAEQDNQLCGFVCLYLNDDPKWGTLIDNIHVTQNKKGEGIGKKLMHMAAEQIIARSKNSTMYLWVIAENTNAIKFYEHRGGKQVERTIAKMPDGSDVSVIRFTWDDVLTLISN